MMLIAIELIITFFNIKKNKIKPITLIIKKSFKMNIIKK